MAKTSQQRRQTGNSVDDYICSATLSVFRLKDFASETYSDVNVLYNIAFTVNLEQTVVFDG